MQTANDQNSSSFKESLPYSPLTLNSIDEIYQLFIEFGHLEYYGSPVTQLEHALQSAMLAEEAGEDSKLITAALFHDLGHLVLYANKVRNEIKSNQDYQHQQIIAGLLTNLFNEEVIEPIRLHVNAKRYLCAVNPQYELLLSPDSLHSLKLQGGRFTAEEAALFRCNAYFEDAIKLRRWDDEAKIPKKITPTLEHYIVIAKSVCNV